MYVFGILGFFQAVFIPGFLLLKIFRIKKNIIQTVVFSYALSLIANYGIVLILSLLGLYTQWVMTLILITEIIALLIYFTDALKVEFAERLQKLTIQLNKFIKERLDIFNGGLDTDDKSASLFWWFSAFAFVFAIISLSWMFGVWQRDWVSVFKGWDAVVSWNAWAVNWASGDFPVDPRHYPQLIPINLSLPYVLMGTTRIQFFSKAIMGLFTLFLLLLLFDLGLTQKQTGYFVAVIMLRYMVKKFFGVFLTAGYVDLPVAFFAFLAVYILIHASEFEEREEKLSYVFLGFVFAAGSAVTKQAGVYLLIFYPALVYLLVLRDMKHSLTRREWGVYVGLPVLIVALLVVPWYLYIEFAIAAGDTRSEVAWVTQGIFQGKSLFARFVDAALMLEKYLVLYLIAFISLSFIKSKQRWIFSLITLPFTLIWMFYLSYSTRNLALALPFVCMAAGLGVEAWVRKGIALLDRLQWQRLKLAWLLIPLLAGIVGLNFLYTAEYLTTSQKLLQKEILESKLNADLYDYFESHGSFELVMSDYPLRYLPDMLYIRDSFDDYASYRMHIAENPDLHYLLVPKNAADTIWAEIDIALEAGQYQKKFVSGRYTLIYMETP